LPKRLATFAIEARRALGLAEFVPGPVSIAIVIWPSKVGRGLSGSR